MIKDVQAKVRILRTTSETESARMKQMALSLLAPVTEVSAATKNKVVEIPVNFTNTGWSEEDDWDTTSKTDAGLWALGELSSYSESYTVSYKLYIPVSFLKEEATVKVGKKVKISATATPATKITYTSSNKKVAAVDAKGTVTGKKAGKATISVKANGKTVKVTVTVKK